MVSPASPPDLEELAHKVDRGSAISHDAVVGNIRSAFWYIRHQPELQYTLAGAAAVLLPLLPGQLVPGPVLLTVSSLVIVIQKY